MKTIWKFSLDLTDSQNLMLPSGAQLLSVAMQGPALCLWALVDPQGAKERRQIEIRGTGHPIEGADELVFIGTVLQNGGQFVWHIFERP